MSTLVTFNGSVLPGNIGTVPGGVPSGSTVDPANGQVFVAEFGANLVQVVSGQTNGVIADVRLDHPDSIAYDPANGLVYVGCQSDDLVAVINPTTDHWVENISLGLEPL
ncbi:MAG: hypothetical protein L3J91_03050, partial [Thermoplasmata archaeon]|nr:hypothetical protein [Thermoplasmata archaeon]